MMGGGGWPALTDADGLARHLAASGEQQPQPRLLACLLLPAAAAALA